MYTFRILTTADEMLCYFDVAKQIGHLHSEEHYRALLNEMLPNSYRQMAVFEGEKCVAISGFWINTKLYCGKYVELDNVVIDENHRNKGIGEMLCMEIEKEARLQGCGAAVLDCFVQNDSDNKFYHRLNYRITGFHYLKNLE